MIKLRYPNFWENFNIITFLLIPFSWVYIFLGYIRCLVVKPIKLPGKVICIGNITVGGTGKTQLVNWVASELEKESKKFVILTKAYKSTLKNAVLVKPIHTASEVGDESIMLARTWPVVAAKNIKDSVSIIKKLNVEYIIVDDGLQSPYFYKDYIFLTIDADRLNGNGFIFPAGPLRQKLNKVIDKISAIIMVGNLQNSLNSNKKKFLHDIKCSSKIICRANIELLTKIERSITYIAFSGIGNPDRFFKLLRENNINISETVIFPDHHDYSISDIEKMLIIAKSNNYELITTEKDFVKIKPIMKKLKNRSKIHCIRTRIFLENANQIIESIKNLS